jgi:phosphonate transport system substrate-binding protein
MIYLGIAAAVGAVAYDGVQAIRATSALRDSQQKMVESFDLTTPTRRHLAPEYSDKSGQLLADPPTDPGKLLDPETIVLSYGEDSDVEIQPVNWDAFQKHLSEVTGKKVVGQKYNNTVEDVAAVKEGQIHIVALHAADTPYLVNNAGFIPIAVLGSGEGALGNHLDLAVAKGSDIKTLSDLRGRTLTCTQPTSITGHRAAIAVLLQESKLRPDVDYFVNYSLGQTKSIMGLAEGDYAAVALSDDKLQSLRKAGRVNPSDYQIIYESQVIPRFTIGHVYNLAPDLAAKVAGAILGFKNEAAIEDEGTGQPMRFFRVDYKRDFEFVRKIDECFDPRLGNKKSKVKVAGE